MTLRGRRGLLVAMADGIFGISHRVCTFFGVLLLLASIGLGECAALPARASSGADVPTLPVPSGQYSIGRQVVDLVDETRADPDAGGAAKHRELMIAVWYPARYRRHAGHAAYFPGAAFAVKNDGALHAAQDVFGPRWPLIASGAITSHAIADAPPMTTTGGFPVVLFLHGLSATSYSYTAQMEDLVSHGYVVVAIEQPDAAGIVVFPGGRIRLFRDPPPPAPGTDPLQAMIASAMRGTETGAQDVRFVLNTLERGGIPLAHIMDLRKVAAVGHSAGGTLAARVCQLDSRIKACISEDGEVNPVGAFFDYPDHAPLRQPFLFMEVAQHPTDADLGHMQETRAQWDAYLAHEREQLAACGAGSYRVMLSEAGMTHASFSDGLLLSAAAGSEKAATASRNLLLTEAIARSFLDKTLKGNEAPLLDSTAERKDGVNVQRIGR